MKFRRAAGSGELRGGRIGDNLKPRPRVFWHSLEPAQTVDLTYNSLKRNYLGNHNNNHRDHHHHHDHDNNNHHRGYYSGYSGDFGGSRTGYYSHGGHR